MPLPTQKKNKATRVGVTVPEGAPGHPAHELWLGTLRAVGTGRGQTWSPGHPAPARGRGLGESPGCPVPQCPICKLEPPEHQDALKNESLVSECWSPELSVECPPPPPYLRGRSSGDNNPQGSGRLPTTRLGPCRTFRSWHDLKMSEPSFFSLLSPSVPGCEPGKRAPGARGIPGRVGLFSAGQRPLLPAGSLMWFVTHPGHPGGHGSSHPSLL